MLPLRLVGTKVFEDSYRAKEKVIVNFGGARSSKSYSIAQLLIIKAFSEKHKNIGICRKTLPSLKRTAMRLVIELLHQYKRYNYCKYCKSEDYIDIPHMHNRIQFFSLDNPERIKSTEFNYIWMEEANEFTWDDFLILMTRLSGHTIKERNQMFLTLNPNEETGWIPTKLLKNNVFTKHDDILVRHSTYKDNPFLTDDYRKELEGLKNTDEVYYKVYTLGEWASVKGLVYTKYKIIPESQMPSVFEESFYGLDFGFNNPMALVFAGVVDKNLYIKEILYESGLTTRDLIEKLKTLIPKTHRNIQIRADSASPDKIQEIYDAGFNCVGVDKNNINTVKWGIDYCKAQNIHVSENSDKVIKELRSYKWREDRNGDPLDEPVKFNDHAMDAMRYAVTGFARMLNFTPEDVIVGSESKGDDYDDTLDPFYDLDKHKLEVSL